MNTEENLKIIVPVLMERGLLTHALRIMLDNRMTRPQSWTYDDLIKEAVTNWTDGEGNPTTPEWQD